MQVVSPYYRNENSTGAFEHFLLDEEWNFIVQQINDREGGGIGVDEVLVSEKGEGESQHEPPRYF